MTFRQVSTLDARWVQLEGYLDSFVFCSTGNKTEAFYKAAHRAFNEHVYKAELLNCDREVKPKTCVNVLF